MATTYYKRAGAGNWSATTSWDTVSSAGAGPAGPPVAGDTAILDSGSGNCTLTAAAACATITCSGYTGTLAFGIYQLTITAAATFPSGMTLSSSGAGGVSLSTAGATLTGGCTFNGVISVSGTAGTYTIDTAGGSWATMTVSGSAARTLALSSTLTVTTLNLVCTGATTFSGAFDIAVTSAYISNGSSGAATTVTFVAGQTLTVSTNLAIWGHPVTALSIVSGTASSDTFLHFNGAAADCKIYSIIFTDVNCAHAIDNWYGGTLTRTTGITNRTSADIGGGAGGAASTGTMRGMAGMLR